MKVLASHLRQTLLVLALSAAPFTLAQAQSDTLRSEVVRPLQAAQDLSNQKKYTEAAARLTALDAVESMTSLETFTVERMRAVIQIGLGNTQAAAKALDKALQTDRGTLPDRLALMENLALIQYREKAYSEAALWAGRYLEQGGQREELRLVQAQALYLSGQWAPAAQLLSKRVDADLVAKRAPNEIQLRLLASAYQQLKNEAGYVTALETMAKFHPNPEIWSDLLYRLMKRQDFPAYLEIDVRRLMRSVGAESSAADYLDHAQLAIMAGFPGEARQVLEAAKGSGKLIEKADIDKVSQMLAQAARLQLEDEKLPLQLDAQLAKARDGNPLVNMGLNLVLSGQGQRGVELIAQGLEKGGLKQPQATRLRLAYALYLTGQAEKANEAFATFNAQTAEDALARLWLIRLNQKS